jgi:hypothetical protein
VKGPLQNRVHPSGEIVATPERGTMLGNRGGRFHRDDKTLGKRRWASRAWICCELHYKDCHHEPMGHGYTSLFFLDEVTALSAGHRPCFMCRRAEAKRFVALSGMGTGELDNILHVERLSCSPSPLWAGIKGGGRAEPSRGERILLHPMIPPDPHPNRPHKGESEVSGMPDGAMVEIDNEAYAIKGAHLLHWSFGGYVEAIPRDTVKHANLLTPHTIIAILANGYQPRWHESAITWEKR